MARLVKDARIYNEAGELVHCGDLRDPVPDFLRQRGQYYILSENREPKDVFNTTVGTHLITKSGPALSIFMN